MPVRLANDLVEVECYPEHGFVIGAIRHHGDPRNILWNPPNASYRPLPTAELGPAGQESIDTFDQDLLAGGWFPMFPNAGLPGDAPDRWMHGEAQRLAWEITSCTDSELVCTLRTPSSGFTLTRAVYLKTNTVIVTTRATNTSDTPQPVTSGEHPCFAREMFAGGTIVTTADTAVVTSHADPLNATLLESAPFSWPHAPTVTGGSSDLGLIPTEPDGRHDHVTLCGTGAATIRSDHVTATLAWDQTAFPYALLWQHFQPIDSPWAGDVFAIEPSRAPGRTSDDAAAAGAVTTVDPGDTITSWVRLGVDIVQRSGGPLTATVTPHPVRLTDETAHR